MSRFSRLGVRGFRRLADVNLEVRPFMVMIGANGSGKTSLLDALGLLAASASGQLNAHLSSFGGITSVLTRDRASELTLEADMEVPEHKPLHYELHLAPVGASYAVKQETLSQLRVIGGGPFKHIDAVMGNVRYYEAETKKLQRPTWEHNPLETSLSQVPRMFREPEQLRQLLSSTTLYHALDVGPKAPVKLPQQMKPAALPGADGEDLIPYLYYLREESPERFEAVTDSLAAAFPGFCGLGIPPVAAGLLALTWRDERFTAPFYTHELSEGTLRFLWLAALLQSPSLPTVTMIDEPEVSLHPELLGLLADLMREASRRTSLIVATHSDRFVRFLKPSEVVVMDVGDDGLAKCTWADSLDLDKWLAEYTLDEVWRMGRMGARA